MDEHIQFFDKTTPLFSPVWFPLKQQFSKEKKNPTNLALIINAWLFRHLKLNLVLVRLMKSDPGSF
jgi:hypothetical protein